MTAYLLGARGQGLGNHYLGSRWGAESVSPSSRGAQPPEIWVSRHLPAMISGGLFAYHQATVPKTRKTTCVEAG